MRISQISLNNFRCYEEATLDLTGGRTMLMGPNGLGKSTLIDAIAWCLTGRCRGVNAKGEGQRDLIRIGGDDMRVSLNIDGIGTVWREISRAGSSLASMKQETLLAKLGADAGMVHAILYGGTFFDLHHGDAKALLMDALNVTVPANLLKGIDTGGIDWLDLDTVEQLFQKHFTLRADAKRRLKNIVVPDKPKVVALKGNTQALDDIRAVLRSHQSDLQEAMAEANAANVEVDDTSDSIDMIAAAVKQAGHLPGAKKAHEDMLAEQQHRLAKADARLSELEATAAEPADQLAAQVSETEALIGKLSRHEPDRGCVLSPSIPCLTKASDFAGHLKDLKGMVKTLGERIAAGRERTEQIAAARQSVKEATDQIAYHEGQLQQTQQQMDKADGHARDLAKLKKALPGLKKEAKARQGVVKEHQDKVTELLDQVTVQSEYQRQQDAYQLAVKQAEDAQAEVDALEAKVAILGPKGARVKVLADTLGVFEQAINVALERFDFSMEIQPEPWQVIVRRGGDTDGIRFEMLSKGQRLWTSVAFQIALAKVSGLDFVVIDDLEAVVGEHLRRLTGLVMTADTGQVLVSIAKGETEQEPTVDGLQVIRMGAAEVTA